jgi:hypothetical protein
VFLRRFVADRSLWWAPAQVCILAIGKYVTCTAEIPPSRDVRRRP